jgi:hypothetical protein
VNVREVNRLLESAKAELREGGFRAFNNDPRNDADARAAGEAVGAAIVAALDAIESLKNTLVKKMRSGDESGAKHTAAQIAREAGKLSLVVGPGQLSLVK